MLGQLCKRGGLGPLSHHWRCHSPSESNSLKTANSHRAQQEFLIKIRDCQAELQTNTPKWYHRQLLTATLSARVSSLQAGSGIKWHKAERALVGTCSTLRETFARGPPTLNSGRAGQCCLTQGHSPHPVILTPGLESIYV